MKRKLISGLFSVPKVKSFLYELILIVLGVLIAFSLSNMQNRKKQRKEKENLLQQCKQELQENLIEFQFGAMHYDSILQTFLEKERALLQPIPKFRNITMIYDVEIWNTAINKGLFDTEALSYISGINSEIRGLRLYTDRMHDFNTQILLPNLDKGTEEFYDSETKRLRKKYMWYPYNLSAIQKRMEQLNVHVEDLLNYLEKT